MGLLKLIFTPLGFVLIGLIAGGVGISMAMEGRDGKVPERTELKQVAGSVQKITKTWKEKRGVKRNVKYEVEMKAADGGSFKLIVPEKRLTEQQAEMLYRGPVTALLRDGDKSDVWELSVGGNSLINYASSRTARIRQLASQAKNGPYLAGSGVVLALVGGVWFFRRRTKDEVA